MPTTTGQNIVDRARIKANDEDATKRWTDAESLMWVNDGQAAVAQLLPSAYTLQATPNTVAGSTRQTLAGLGLSAGLTVVDIPRNYSTDGLTPGRAMTKRDRVWFDEHRPRWHSEMAAEAQHWMQDDRDPKAVYIYPAKTAGKLEVIYSAVPTALASLASTITLDDIYANALQWFLLFSWYSKDATNNRGQQLASTYYALFERELGIRSGALTANAKAGDAKAAGA